MNITFLIGNGFDLNLGLQTQYNHFLEEYKKISLKDNANIRRFKKEIKQDSFLWSNAELAFGEYTECFDGTERTAKEFIECYADFCTKLSAYLFRQEERLNYRAIHSSLSQNFAEAITHYYMGFRETQKTLIQKSEKNFLGGYNFNFLNFNYTETLDAAISAVSETAGLLGKRKVLSGFHENKIHPSIHVHGKLGLDMVFAVNDETQLKNTALFSEYAEFLRQLIKQYANEMAENNVEQKAVDVLNQSDLIYVYGMSLGATDTRWWTRICTLLKDKPSLRLILHAYDAPERTLFSWEYQKFSREKRELFLSYCDFDEDKKADIANRIHIDDSNIFCELQDIVDSEENKTPKVNSDSCPMMKY